MRIKIIVTIIISVFYTVSKAQDVNDARGLQIGERVEDFSATSSDNKLISLDDMLKEGKVVLVFYRGEWCPICNRHLQKLQDSLNFILEKGANVYAISPDELASLIRTKEKSSLAFSLLSDANYKIANQFDVNFVPTKKDVDMYNQYLNAQLGLTDQLPIPAVFIINQDKEITWRFFNPDYKKRATVKDVLDNL